MEIPGTTELNMTGGNSKPAAAAASAESLQTGRNQLTGANEIDQKLNRIVLHSTFIVLNSTPNLT